MKRFLSMVVVVAGLAGASWAAESEEGFVSLFDGKTFTGWKMATEHTNAWTIKDGAFRANGERCHLFYVGDEKPFKNFEFKVDVMTEPNSNGGIYFHTRYQATDWPRGGFECQVNNTQGDWKKTGSLYDVVNLNHNFATDNKWWTQHIKVEGNKVTVRVDGKIVLEYTEAPGAQPTKPFERKISEGTFAFQAHDPGSTIYYKNIRVKRLP